MPRRALLRDPDFLKLWVGQTISQIGSAVTSIGLPLTAVLALGASPLQMGALAGAGAVPVLALGLFAGAWADRLRRRPILIASDLARAAVLATVPLAAAMHRLTMAHLYAVAMVTGLLTVLFDVSYQAYLPSLVDPEDLVEGNSKLALSQSIAEIAGPGLTGVLIQLITAPVAILYDAISFLFSAVSLWLIHKPDLPPERTQEQPMVREISAGLRTVWRNPVLRALAGRAVTGAFFAGFGGSLYFLFATRELGLGAAMIGLIISVGGASNLVGALVAERLVRRLGLGPTMIGAAMVSALALLVVPLARGSAAACTAVLLAAQLSDAAWPVYNINETSLRQAITPNQLLGRVNSVTHLFFQGGLPLGALAGGAIAQVIGLRLSLLVGATGFLLSTLWLVFSPVRWLREIPKMPMK